MSEERDKALDKIDARAIAAGGFLRECVTERGAARTDTFEAEVVRAFDVDAATRRRL